MFSENTNTCWALEGEADSVSILVEIPFGVMSTCQLWPLRAYGATPSLGRPRCPHVQPEKSSISILREPSIKDAYLLRSVGGWIIPDRVF